MTEKDENDRFIYSLEELKALVKTADGMVVHTLTQKRINPHPATYVGEGKLEEIKAICVEEEIDVVIANHELSGGGKFGIFRITLKFELLTEVSLF